MASCLHCGSDLNGLYCNMCGARAEEKHPVKRPKAAPRGSFRPMREEHPVTPVPQPASRNANKILIGVGLLVSALLFGLWLRAPSAAPVAADAGEPPAEASPHSPDLSDLPPVAAAEWYMDRGAGYMQEGNQTAAVDSFRKAATQFEKALTEDPGNLYAGSYLGLTYFYMGDGEKARTTERKVLEQDPNYLWAIFNLAWMEEVSGRMDQAILLYRKYLDAADEERKDRIKYAEQYELIDRQIEAARLVLENFGGGPDQ